MCSIPKIYTIILFTGLGILFLTLLQATFNSTFEQLVVFQRPEWQNESYPQVYLERSKLAHTLGTLTSFIGGAVANRYRGGLVFGVGALLSATINIAVRYLVFIDLSVILLAKFIDGLIAGAAFSSVAGVWSQWSTLWGVSKFIAFTSIGHYIALLLDKWVIQAIAEMFGWHLVILQSIGIATAIWATFWLLLIKNDSSEGEIRQPKTLKLATYPWTRVLTCAPLWALCIVGFAFTSGSTFLHSYLPSYMLKRKYIDEETCEDLMLPSSVDMLANLITAAYVEDSMRSEQLRTKTKINKLFICAAFVAQSVSLMGYLFAAEVIDSDTFFDLVYLSRTFSEIAILANVIDLSPKYASFLYGILRTFFTLGTIFTEQYMENTNYVPWSYRFSVFSALYSSSAAIYYVFGSGELQLWDKNDKDASHDEQHELQNV